MTFLVSLAGGFTLDLFGYLFGNVLAIDPEEVWVAFLLALAVPLIPVADDVIILPLVGVRSFRFLVGNKKGSQL